MAWACSSVRPGRFFCPPLLCLNVFPPIHADLGPLGIKSILLASNPPTVSRAACEACNVFRRSASAACFSSRRVLYLGFIGYLLSQEKRSTSTSTGFGQFPSPIVL